MKILFVIPSITRCGPTNVAYNLISYLKSKGMTILLCYLWEGDNPDFNFVVKNTDYNYHLNGFGFHSFIKLYRIIVGHKPDICHSHGLIFDLYLLIISKFKTKTKYISTLHCNIDEDYSSTYSAKPIKLFILKYIHKFALSRLDLIVPVSHSASKSLNSNNKVVVYNGTKKDDVKLSISNEVELIFVGKLIRRKNVQFILKNLNNDENIFKFIIIGDGPQLNELKTIANERDDVKFVGFSTEPESWYTKNSIFINPSISEGMPMAVIEALSCGLPCLLSNIYSHQEIQGKFKKGVELFDLEGSDFMEKLLKLKSIDDKSRLQIVKDWEMSFSIGAMGKQYMNTYKSLLGQ